MPMIFKNTTKCHHFKDFTPLWTGQSVLYYSQYHTPPASPLWPPTTPTRPAILDSLVLCLDY